MKKIFLFLCLAINIQLFSYPECEVTEEVEEDCSIAGPDEFPPYGPGFHRRCTGTWW